MLGKALYRVWETDIHFISLDLMAGHLKDQGMFSIGCLNEYPISKGKTEYGGYPVVEFVAM